MDGKLISKDSDNWLLILLNVKAQQVVQWEDFLGRSMWNFVVLLQEAPSSNLSRVSPLSSWLIFRRNSNKGDNRRTKGSRRTSKVRVSRTCTSQVFFILLEFQVQLEPLGFQRPHVALTEPERSTCLCICVAWSSRTSRTARTSGASRSPRPPPAPTRGADPGAAAQTER